MDRQDVHRPSVGGEAQISGPLISPHQLRDRLQDPAWAVVDVRTDLHDPEAGRRKWLSGRIPGSIHLDLDRDLSQITEPEEGRHPLPAPREFAERLRQLGLGAGLRLAVYDEVGGAIAARLWWMMRWLRGLPVSVLDGGFGRWVDEGGPVEQGPPAAGRPPAGVAFKTDPRPREWASFSEVRDRGKDCLLLDARGGERYRGESEPIDPRAGHIPGAVSAPFADNLTGPDRRFKSPEELRRRFADLGAAEAESIVCYCGSGVTACHNLLALELAGFGDGRLYVGSWSQWCHRVAPSPEELSVSAEELDLSMCNERRAASQGDRRLRNHEGG